MRSEKVGDCGCRLERHSGGLIMIDCPLHKAAPELLEALEAIQANPNDPRAHRQALDAIKKARGE